MPQYKEGNKRVVTENKTSVRYKNTTKDYLGARKYLYDKANEADKSVLSSLAWTPVGGNHAH